MSAYRRLFIDFDSFYASVEQQDNIFYRDKPLIVVPCVSDYTCAIAASYEAKRIGIKTGTRVRDAKVKASNLIVVEARPKRYVEVHNQIIEILYKHFTNIQILSIDEMAPGAPRPWHGASSPHRLPQSIPASTQARCAMLWQ